MIAAAGDAIWDDKKACGRSYYVKCIGSTNKAPETCKEGEVAVLIVDRCHKCPATINLSQAAFMEIADPSAGKIMINYEL
ncbi:Expansin [Trema orientale]|uniref:Expansin n=1 Tax=Trema orientale TaxID=63057 RepID=A0A2P5FUL5_TREOI|nr:Expansin [Trema orientale]